MNSFTFHEEDGTIRHSDGRVAAQVLYKFGELNEQQGAAQLLAGAPAALAKCLAAYQADRIEPGLALVSAMNEADALLNL